MSAQRFDQLLHHLKLCGAGVDIVAERYKIPSAPSHAVEFIWSTTSMDKVFRITNRRFPAWGGKKGEEFRKWILEAIENQQTTNKKGE